MKRKLLSVLLTLAMALALLSVSAMAEGEEVAQIGETKYVTLADAIAAAKNGDTITLLADVIQNTMLTIDKNITLDLGGKKIYNTENIWSDTNKTYELISVEAKVTITGDGSIEAKENDCYTINVKNGNLTIENGRFVGNVSVVQVEKGTLTINGGEFKLLQKWEGSSKYLINCIDENYENKTAVVDIRGGKFVDFDPNVAPEKKVDGKAPSFVTSAGIGVDANSDGTFTAKSGMVAQIIDAKGNSKKACETLQAAIDAAVRNNTVKLLADTRENVTIDKAMTLDLNGHTLNGGTVKGTPTLKIDTARVTVMDSSEAQTGTIMREDTAENSGVSSHYVIDVQGKNALLTFNSGNVRNNSGNADGSKGASLVRVGNDSDKKAHPVLTIAGGAFTQDNFIVIKVDFGTLHLKGGTVSSKTSYAVENWLNANIKGNAVVNGAVSSWTYSGGSNSTLEISGGTVNGNVEAVSYDGSVGKKASVSIIGGTVNGTLSTKRYNNATAPGKDMATIEVTAGTFSQDPSKYLVEGSAATPNSDGTYGVAKAYLAKVGDTSYYTMDEAFKAQTASCEPIVLLRDYTTGSPFSSGSIDRVVDLNGHTWTCTGTAASSAAFEINYSNASLTVKNGKIVSSQLVGLIPSAMSGTIKYDNSSLTFENVEMTTTATSGIETNGNNTNDSVMLKNSTLNVPNGFGIYFPSSGTLTIDNSTINAKTMGVQVCAGSLSINAGSTITVSGDAVPKTGNDGAIQDGAAISIVNRTGYKGLGNITVTGGTFTAKSGNAAIKAYNWDNANKNEDPFTESDKVSVSGGYFTSDPTAYLAARHYVWASDKDGYAYMVKDTAPTSADQKIIVIDKTEATVNGSISADDKSKIEAVKDKTNVDGVAEAVAAKKADLIPESVDTSAATKVEVEVNVKVEAKAADLANGKLTFEASPVATVKVNGAATGTTVPVTNDMLNGQPITVKLPLPAGFELKQIIHKSAGYADEYILQEGNAQGLKSFKIVEEDGVEIAVFTVSHFSDFELSGKVTYVAPSYSGSSSDPTYSVSTPSKTENGSVTVSPKSASKGDTVTVTVKPDSGYVLETLTVTDKNGNELTLKDKGNGKYTFTMPAGKVEVKATFMEDNSMLNFFYDVPNNAYFYEAVKWAVKNGITTGVGDNLFAPEQPCTRAQIVTFLWRAAGSPEPKGAASGMSDVVSGSYYEKAVAWAIENGITTGTTTSTFSPDATCTRAQAVTFLARALKAKAASTAEFSDVPTDSYFADAVAWAAANGVTEGIGGGLFGSDNDCTRGQIVTFLYRAYNK